MTAAAGATTTTQAKVNLTPNADVWEAVTIFSLVDGDTTGAATVPLNGILRKVIITLTDMDAAEGTTDVSLTDNDDNTVFSVTNLAESATYVYSVDELFSEACKIVLGFTDPDGTATVTVTLRGI